MRNFVLACFVVLSAISCTKTKTNTVTLHDTTVNNVLIHDTTVYQPTLIGSWNSGFTADIQPTFTADTLSWTTQSPYRYLATPDSIYAIGSNHVVFAIFYYHISKTNDTLYMGSLGTDGVKAYHRSH